MTKRTVMEQQIKRLTNCDAMKGDDAQTSQSSSDKGNAGRLRATALAAVVVVFALIAGACTSDGERASLRLEVVA